MVGSFGMGGSLVSWDAAGGPPGANVVTKVLSSDTDRAAVERILEQAKEQVTAMLSEHRHIVEALRDALLDRDELIGEEIVDVIRSADPAVIDLRTDIRDETLA
jgi:ATP-dependent Zn protease